MTTLLILIDGLRPDAPAQVDTPTIDGLRQQGAWTLQARSVALPDDSAVLLQSDHGGHEHTHGTEIPEDMLIPWIIAGPHIKQNHEIQHPVTLLDTTPTLTAVLSIDPSPEWEGASVAEIFKENMP